MYFLTGGVTSEGDTFLIAILAALLAIVLYPAIGVWAFLAFPVVFVGAVSLRRAVRRHRRRSSLLDQSDTFAVMDQAPAERILRAIDSTEELIHNAPDVPLVDQARIPKRDLDAAVAAVREAATAEWADSDASFSSALADLERLAASAREIPLTRDVRLDRAHAMGALETLRGRIPESLKHDRWGSTEPVE